MLENHNYSQVIGEQSAPYLNELARGGALFTHSRAITHPSQPNYLALFSGSTQGVTGDDCPQRFTGPNLASELLAAGYTFTGYAQGLPGAGSNTCNVGRYGEPITHYSVLRTIENLYHLRPLGHAAHATPITNMWG
jgi:acid phosphatase